VANSVYKVTEIIGTSNRSWEDAAKRAVETAAKSLRELRVAEVSELDVTVEDGKVKSYRAKVKLSFKYEADSESTAPAATASPKRPVKKKVAKKKARRR
jgi:dodecin